MMKSNVKQLSIQMLALLAVSGVSAHAFAKADAGQVAKLGATLTCNGAEKAAGDGVAAYTGKWKGAPPGVTNSAGVYGNPYANEQPIVVVTAANMAQHLAKLSPGQQALLKKYPDYKMNVYPSHRDFATEGDCKYTKTNATSGELTDGGEGVTGVVQGGAPFPFPKNGLEAVWNTKFGVFGLTTGEHAIQDSAAVQPSGAIAKGKEDYRLGFAVKAGDVWPAEKPTAYFFVTTLLPERSKGEIVSGWDSGNYAKAPRQAWQYQPGTRRVRELPEFGFDFPRGPGGLRTVDDDRLFNGTPERYDWSYLGKKTLYVPYNAYIHEDPNLKYSDLLTPKFPNPKYMRWETHRVHVVDGKLKSGQRHNYARRVLFLQEDTWSPVMSDFYDARGQLWRTAWQNYVYAYDAKTIMPRSAYYVDLNSGAYFADRLWQETGKAPVIGSGKFTSPNDYGANALRSAGK